MPPLLFFTPGAGAPTTSEWMQAWAARLGALGEVVPWDYAYHREGRRRPDPTPRLVAEHRAAASAACPEPMSPQASSAPSGTEPMSPQASSAPSETPARPLFLVGKSLGSRIACLVARELPVSGVVCFGFPLLSPAGRSREDVLLGCPAPVLLVQGDRDELAPLPAIREVLARRSAPWTLHTVPGGDHSLVLRRKDERQHGTTQAASDAAVLAAVARFIHERGALPPR